MCHLPRTLPEPDYARLGDTGQTLRPDMAGAVASLTHEIEGAGFTELIRPGIAFRLAAPIETVVHEPAGAAWAFGSAREREHGAGHGRRSRDCRSAGA